MAAILLAVKCLPDIIMLHCYAISAISEATEVFCIIIIIRLELPVFAQTVPNLINVEVKIVWKDYFC